MHEGSVGLTPDPAAFVQRHRLFDEPLRVRLLVTSRTMTSASPPALLIWAATVAGLRAAGPRASSVMLCDVVPGPTRQAIWRVVAPVGAELEGP